MNELLGVLGALSVLVLPLALVWWLLRRQERRPQRRKRGADREKMPR